MQWEEDETKKCLNSIIKKTNRGSKIWAEIDTYNFLKKKQYESIQEIDNGVCLKKRAKNWEIIVKIKATVCFKKVKSHHYWTFLCHIMTNVAYFWLKSKIYPKKVPVMTNNTLIRAEKKNKRKNTVVWVDSFVLFCTINYI